MTEARPGMPIDDPGHPLLADFVALNEPATRRRVERDGGYFVVEGMLAVERLLQLRDRWRIRSIALLPRVAERLGPLLAGLEPVLAVTDEATLRRVVGFDLHRGALASVERVPLAEPAPLVAGSRLLLVAEGVNDHENLGALYRNAAAFGVDAVLLDDRCSDPFYRRSVRVSVGAVLGVPTGALGTLPGALDALHALGVETVALTPGGTTALRDLDLRPRPGSPVAVLVGAEGPGLQDATLAGARHRVAIPMAPGADSLNVATAAAIALHHLSG